MRITLGLLLLAPLVAAACSSSAPVQGPSSAGDVIGGFDAKSPALNAVGTIGFAQNGQYAFFCTGTLIGPHTVLTAKHCAVDTSPAALPDGGSAPAPTGGSRRYFTDEGTVVFGIGPNASAPVRTVPVATVAVSPVDGGGFVGLGSDVAVYTLSEEVHDVTPLKVAPAAPDGSLVGQTLLGVGFGYQDQTRTIMGGRRAASLTVRAVTGKALESVFGSADAFFTALAKEQGEAFVDAHKSEYQELYDTTLVDQYELYAGAATSNAQVCDGESGGPLVAKQADGSRVVVGVASGVMSTDRLPCAFGAAYGTFGPKVQEMISAALEDPCGSLDTNGRCQGNSAVRCTAPSEGARAVVKVDCGARGQTCGTDERGAAACADASPVAPAGAPDAG